MDGVSTIPAAPAPSAVFFGGGACDKAEFEGG